MKPTRLVYKILIGIALMVISSLLVFLTMPKDSFIYNMDVALSPVGMILGKMYLHHPEIQWYNQGYIDNGQFVLYRNWPPLSFRALALWFKLMEDSSIFSGRLLSALLYGFNALLFFFLLLKKQITVLVAFLSSMIFVLLPTHLDYSSLIYVDVWLITFWLLSLCVYDSKNILRKLLFVTFTIIGTCFNWFVIFILPFPWIISLIKKANADRKVIVFSFITLIVFVWGLQVFIFYHFPDNSLLKEFGKYSIVGFFNDFSFYYSRLLTRLGTVGYEMFFLIPLVLYYKFCSDRFPNLIRKLNSEILIVSLAVVAYLIVFPNWFVIHRQVLFLFSIPIGMFAALILSELGKKGISTTIKGGLISITTCLIMYASLPYVSNTMNDIEEQDHSIALFIKDEFAENDIKPCIFYDVPSRIDRKMIFSPFALRELTNTYIFNLEELEPASDLNLSFRTGVLRLKKIGMTDFNASSVFFISKDKYSFDDSVIQNYQEINGINVYHINL
jgi:hypothetical protein